MNTKNKIIVTGLALAADSDPSECPTCNIDTSWIFQHPSTLLWADSIIISPSAMDTIKKGIPFGIDNKVPAGNPQLQDVLKIFFDLAGENGLLEEKNPEMYINEELRKSMRTQVEDDQNKLIELFPDIVTVDADEFIHIGDFHYCYPRILAIYYNLLLAGIWGARPLLDDASFTFLKYSFGSRISCLDDATKRLTTFNELFSEQLPEINITPVEAERSCSSCHCFSSCDNNDIRKIEAKIKNYIKLRDYDELSQMKQVFTKLSSQIEAIGNDDFPRDMKKIFENTKKKLNKKLNKTSPVIERWSNLSTIISAPVIIAGVATSSPTIALIGAGIAGISKVTEQYTKFFASKNRWMFFRQK